MIREKWLDNIRAIACILVATGHCVMGLDVAGLVPDYLKNIVLWYINTAYYIHVPIFFFVSGYLHQGKTYDKSSMSYVKYIFVKICDLGIPYLIFCMSTVFIKNLLNDYVNNSSGSESLWNVLFIQPPNQMWFLLALLACFVITPFRLKNKWQAVALLGVGLVLKCIFEVITNTNDAYIKVLGFAIWFFLGMSVRMISIEKIKCKYWKMGLLIYIVLSVFTYQFSRGTKGIVAFFMSLFGILILVSLCYLGMRETQPFIMKNLANYMFQIYLLHTYFAAMTRIVLLYIGITNIWIHIILGFVTSFLFPILVAFICEKLGWLNCIFFPYKTWRRMKRKKYDFNNNTSI